MAELHPRPFIPFMVAAAGVGTFSLMDAAMKDLALSLGAYNAVMWRNCFGALLMGLLFVGTRQKWPPAHILKMHLWRSIIVSVMAVSFFWSLTQLPLAEAIGLSFIAPVIALYLAAVMLGETIGRSAICASLAGEQGSATAFINQGRYQGWVRGVDYLLAEKAVGAGINGRRSVKIEWENVEGMNPWRFGLSAAVGLEPPESLFADTGRQVDGWRVQLPMFTPTIRAQYAPAAAALGILSNRNMVDLYAQVLDDPDAPDAVRSRAESLGYAYTASGADAKVAAMTSLWTTAAAGADYQGSLVMTARAAALITPSDDHQAEADRLIASMLTAGLDRSAARWSDVVADGSLGWALLTLAAPGRVTAADYGSLDDFFDNDGSTDGHKSRLLLAGLSGLGRIESDAGTDFAGDLKINIFRQTAWSKAITAAAKRGEQGTVALMVMAALQAPSWSLVPANHLYYIVRSLRQVGLEAEARMIAAEAVTFA